jgi:predicted dehydrogenase
VIGLDHGHIYGMCNGLCEAGAEVKLVYDPDPQKVEAFIKAFPGARAARQEAEVLDDSAIRLVAGAPIPARRGELGLKAMSHGKHCFTDKPPFTTRGQLQLAKAKTAETGLRWAVYYSERIHVESSVLAERLINEGAIGRVVQVIAIAPHRISLSQRPPGFLIPGSTAASLWILAATRWSSSCITPRLRMPGSIQAGWPTTTSSSTAASRISATLPLPPTTEPPHTCGWTG